MTVSELIRELQAYSPEMSVVIDRGGDAAAIPFSLTHGFFAQNGESDRGTWESPGDAGPEECNAVMIYAAINDEPADLPHGPEEG